MTFAVLMLKKTLLSPRTMNRPAVVEKLGTTMFSEPSLGVLASTSVGKVSPPSVEKKMDTVGVLMAPALVPATFQLIGCCVSPSQVTGVLGLVTAKVAQCRPLSDERHRC